MVALFKEFTTKKEKTRERVEKEYDLFDGNLHLQGVMNIRECLIKLKILMKQTIHKLQSHRTSLNAFVWLL